MHTPKLLKFGAIAISFKHQVPFLKVILLNGNAESDSLDLRPLFDT